MKNLALLVTAVLVSSYTFANVQPKEGSSLKSVGSAFKSQQVVSPKIDPKDITMGYAGQDISSKPSLS
jgi:hypothetical protein